MYPPLGVSFVKVWDVPRIPPDRRVASSASSEARRIKRGIAVRHLEALCRYEEELFMRVDSDVVNAIYSKFGLQMPTPMLQQTSVNTRDKGSNDGAGTMRERDADYKMIQSARSRFHPVREARDQAVANLVLLEEQEMEKWKENAADWGVTAVDCDVPGTAEASASEWAEDDIDDNSFDNSFDDSCDNSYDNSYDNSDTDSEWPDDDEHPTQWEESDTSGHEAEDQQFASSKEQQTVDGRPSDCVVRYFRFGLPTPPPSEAFSPPCSPVLPKREPTSGAEYSGTDQEEPSENHSHATEELSMVLNDKKILTVYLASIDEGMKDARKTKVKEHVDRERSREFYAGPIQRPREARVQNGKWAREQSEKPAEEEKPLRWFEHEKMHVYDESSGKWELTVERRGRNYELARPCDTETLNQTKAKMNKLGVGNQDWTTDTEPDWAVATGSGWFD